LPIALILSTLVDSSAFVNLKTAVAMTTLASSGEKDIVTSCFVLGAIIPIERFRFYLKG